MSLLTNRLLLGALLLFAVDLIWVLSSELSDHIYHEEHYDKPFFTVFVKTTMFIIFLVGRIGCNKESCMNNGGNTSNSDGYRLITDVDEEERQEGGDDVEGASNSANNSTIRRIVGDISEETDEELPNQQVAVFNPPPPPLLSPPAFVPINYNTDDNTSDDNNGNVVGDGGNKAVKFSRVAEVRHMSPKDAHEATMSRMSYHASLIAQEQAFRTANRLSSIETARVALTFCGMWFLANYTYALSISTSSNQVALINVLSSTSSLFTLFLSAAFPSTPTTDKLTISKLCLVLISLCGVTLVSLEKTSNSSGGGSIGAGAVWALVSAGFYAGYLVFLRKSVDGEQDKMDVFLFFGFVGLFNVLLLWPFFLVLHFSGMETFVLPTHRQWLFLVVNGIVGTVFSEVLWVWSCLLTSSLIATLAITLTIPMSMIADVFFKHVSYTWWFYIGSIPVVLAFVGVTALGNWGDWDPIGDCLKCPQVVRTSNSSIDEQEPDTTTLLDDDEVEQVQRSSINS